MARIELDPNWKKLDVPGDDSPSARIIGNQLQELLTGRRSRRSAEGEQELGLRTYAEARQTSIGTARSRQGREVRPL